MGLKAKELKGKHLWLEPLRIDLIFLSSPDGFHSHANEGDKLDSSVDFVNIPLLGLERIQLLTLDPCSSNYSIRIPQPHPKSSPSASFIPSLIPSPLIQLLLRVAIIIGRAVAILSRVGLSISGLKLCSIEKFRILMCKGKVLQGFTNLNYSLKFF